MGLSAFLYSIGHPFYRKLVLNASRVYATGSLMQLALKLNTYPQNYFAVIHMHHDCSSGLVLNVGDEQVCSMGEGSYKE